MLLTKPQVCRFFREWSAIVSAAGWPHDRAEVERHSLLARAGFDSLTRVDKLTGFDSVLAEIKAIRQPSSLDAQLRQENMPRTRLLYSCRQKADEPYIIALARDRFHADDWTTLPLESLEQLRNTLADRAVAQHRPDTQARRRSAPRSRLTTHESRITFPTLPPSAIPAPDPELVSGPF